MKYLFVLKKNNSIFCIAEFENTIRVIGKLDTKNITPKPGQLIKFTKCTLNDKPKFFFCCVNTVSNMS